LLFWGICLNPTEFVPSAVQFVSAPEVGVPSTGVVRACEAGSTTVPVNVGEARGALSSRAVCNPEVLAIDSAASAIAVAFPVEVTTPVRLALVVIAIFAVPSKEVPPIVRAVWRAVAVPALPVIVVGVAGIACLWSRLAVVVATHTTAASENACVDGSVTSKARIVSSLRKKFVEDQAVLVVPRTTAGVPHV